MPSARKQGPVTHGCRLRPASQAVALALLILATGAAQAAEFGRARTLSGVGQPLRVEIPVERLAPGESATTLVVRVEGAQAADAGLTGREPLAVEAILRPRADGGLVAVLVSPEPVRLPVADLRLTLDSVGGTQQRRLILMLPAALRPGVSPISLAGPSVTPPGDTITVRAGDTAGRIAQRVRAQRGYDQATLYQVLAAVLQANPSAFIDGNLNRLRTGARLTVPDAATVRAIDAAEARRLYARHMADFAAYRARTARSAGTMAAVAPTGQAQGAVRAQANAAVPPSGRDELRLSAVSNPAASGQAQIDQLLDERAATQRALADAQSRVGELESTLADMRRLLERQNETLARLQGNAAVAVAPTGATATAQGVVGGQRDAAAVGAGSSSASPAPGTRADAAGVADGASAATGAGHATASVAAPPGAPAVSGADGQGGPTGDPPSAGAGSPTAGGAAPTGGTSAVNGAGAGAAQVGSASGNPAGTGSGRAVTGDASAGGASGNGATEGGVTPTANAASGGTGGGSTASRDTAPERTVSGSATAGAGASASPQAASGASTSGSAPVPSGSNPGTANGAGAPAASGDTAVRAATGAGPAGAGAASPASADNAAGAVAPSPAAPPHWLDTYFWPVLVLSLAFVVAVLAFVFRRRRPPHEAEAVERPLPVDFDLDLDSPPSDGPGKSRPRPPHAP